MSVHQVDNSFNPSVIRWPEHTEYTVRDGTHELRLFWNDPAPATVAAITAAPCDLAVAHLRGVLFLLYRFEGGVALSAAAYTRGHGEQGGRGGKKRTPASPEPAPAETDDVLSVYLVDARTGMLRGTRIVSLSSSMSAALESALREQNAMPFQSNYAYGREVFWAQSPYSSAAAMLPYAITHCRCGG
jgi:hypothetical protein